MSRYRGVVATTLAGAALHYATTSASRGGAEAGSAHRHCDRRIQHDDGQAIVLKHHLRYHAGEETLGVFM